MSSAVVQSNLQRLESNPKDTIQRGVTSVETALFLNDRIVRTFNDSDFSFVLPLVDSDVTLVDRTAPENLDRCAGCAIVTLLWIVVNIRFALVKATLTITCTGLNARIRVTLAVLGDQTLFGRVRGNGTITKSRGRTSCIDQHLLNGGCTRHFQPNGHLLFTTLRGREADVVDGKCKATDIRIHGRVHFGVDCLLSSREVGLKLSSWEKQQTRSVRQNDLERPTRKNRDRQSAYHANAIALHADNERDDKRGEKKIHGSQKTIKGCRSNGECPSKMNQFGKIHLEGSLGVTTGMTEGYH